jgi:hypothetical protein
MTMKKEKNKEERASRVIIEKEVSPAPNDGTHTPVPDRSSTRTPNENEKALRKQAENPLGYPDREN